jgi:hypothetical protein
MLEEQADLDQFLQALLVEATEARVATCIHPQMLRDLELTLRAIQAKRNERRLASRRCVLVVETVRNGGGSGVSPPAGER